MSTTARLPLFVDLDGTLLKTDLLIESGLALIKQRPGLAWRLPLWLARGKAHLKHRIAAEVDLDPAGLPYDAPVLAHLHAQRAAGREIHLATAADQRYARSIAQHLGLFDSVLCSDGHTNLSGRRKLAAIQATQPSGFAYAGNDWVDLPIWQASQAAILVDVSDGLANRVERTRPIEARFASRDANGPRLSDLWRALRPHQWLKNLLVFLPLLPIATLVEPALLVMALLAFAAFSLCASSVYVLNDLSDLAADRAHPRKRLRPFASGALAPQVGLLMAPLLLAAAGLVALWLPPAFMGMLGLYWLSTTAYTFVVKRHALLDVGTLAWLYTLRVLGGAAAISVQPSFWILVFSMFIFFSLALSKRYTELETMRALARDDAAGRGYRVSDAPLVLVMGVASGYLAVLVMALYINSAGVVGRYGHAQLLWGVCPLLMLWVSRVWLKATRGEMNDDPLVFALKDRLSRWLTVAAAAVVLLALL